ncbi:Methyltransferase-like protein 22 [Dufourea novaeangliae]|uniref:Methyltransferase-like protein 22 n=1 Tax=Dufourea novaeangliae TaxID=178035 RepID=A0A154PCD8_DUFNO|nr:Methyltransferase-like protein 22 [Dufourea novaeangliae]
MTLYKVTSEIFTENKNSFVTLNNGKHYTSTKLQHVGLQVWRGALLLADYILSNPDLFKNKTVLELGAGVGLTSIVASFLAKEVICTEPLMKLAALLVKRWENNSTRTWLTPESLNNVDVEGILRLIRRNFLRNNDYVRSRIYVKELDFLNVTWPTFYEKRMKEATIILAADVIYDENITEGFVQTLKKLLNSEVPKVVYIALEKRYVFTTANMDTTAPMYEEFLKRIETEKQNWHIEYIKIDFPRYFKYDRLKQMILMKIENKLSD